MSITCFVCQHPPQIYRRYYADALRRMDTFQLFVDVLKQHAKPLAEQAAGPRRVSWDVFFKPGASLDVRMN